MVDLGDISTRFVQTNQDPHAGQAMASLVASLPTVQCYNDSSSGLTLVSPNCLSTPVEDGDQSECTYLCHMKSVQAVNVRTVRNFGSISDFMGSKSFISLARETAGFTYITNPSPSAPLEPMVACKNRAACIEVSLRLFGLSSQSLLASARNRYPRLFGFQNWARSGNPRKETCRGYQ